VETRNFSNTQKMQCVSLLEKFWHLYSGMQESSMLNSFIGAHINAYCYTLCRLCVAICRMRPGHLFGVWSCNTTSQTQTAHVRHKHCSHFTGNFWTIHPTVLTFLYRTTTCLSHWSDMWEDAGSKIRKKKNDYSRMAANTEAWFLSWLTIKIHTKMEQMHQCCQELHRKLMTLQCNTWVTFNVETLPVEYSVHWHNIYKVKTDNMPVNTNQHYKFLLVSLKNLCTPMRKLYLQVLSIIQKRNKSYN
jgi:hypothetical protein